MTSVGREEDGAAPSFSPLRFALLGGWITDHGRACRTRLFGGTSAAKNITALWRWLCLNGPATKERVMQEQYSTDVPRTIRSAQVAQVGTQ